MSNRPVNMQRVMRTAAIALVAFTVSVAWAAGPHKAPEFTYPDVNPKSETFGESMSLSDVYDGKGVVLNFIASWCAPCWRELPHFQKLSRESTTPVLLIAADEHGPKDDLLARAAALEVTLPILLVPADEIASMEARYDHSMLPSTYMVDHEGYVRQVFQGMISEESLYRAASRHYPDSGVKAPARKQGLTAE